MAKNSFYKIIKKATNDNHFRQRLSRIFKANENHPVIETILSTKIKPKKVLEIGCSTGFVLKTIQSITKAKCYGVDTSRRAVNEGKKLFKNINIKNGFFEDKSFKKSEFDLIICGFFLYSVPPDKILKIFSKIDDSLNYKGNLIIHDFYNKGFRKKKYKHNKFLVTYRYDFKKIFLSLPHFKLKYTKIFKKKNWLENKKKLNNDAILEVSLLKKVIF